MNGVWRGSAPQMRRAIDLNIGGQIWAVAVDTNRGFMFYKDEKGRALALNARFPAPPLMESLGQPHANVRRGSSSCF
jgi:hypothetical protein